MAERMERMDDGNRSTLLYILAALLFIGGLLLLVVVVNLRSRADDSTTSATITNAAPTVDSVTVAETSQGLSLTNISLNENTTKNIYVYGSYTDNNGCADVTSIALQFYNSGTGGVGCAANDNRCYNNNSTGYNCSFTSVPGDSCSGGTDVTANYQCSVPIQYFAEPNDLGSYDPPINWVARITATDAALATGYSTRDVTVNTLTALDVGSSINYGSLGVGATSASDAPLVISNTGNNNSLRVYGSGTNMACTVGSIPVGNQHYSVVAGADYNSMIPLTGSQANTGAIITKATSASTPSTYTIYWKLRIPSSGLSGSCSGTSTFSAN